MTGSQKSWKQRFTKAVRRDKNLYLMFLPIFVWYIIFCYVPLYGIVLAFRDFVPGAGVFGGPWVGFKYFQQFFSTPYFWRVIRNTILINIYSLLWGFPIPIIFAICITEMKNKAVQRTVQTVSYLPYFISTVVVCGMIRQFLAVDNGVINQIIVALGGNSIDFLSDPKWFRTVYVASDIWQGFGFSSIIYIATISGIDPQLYEAAEIDGITKFQSVRYITIPGLMPLIMMQLLLSLGSILGVGFQKIYLLYNNLTKEVADVISTYTYERGIVSNQYSYSTAVGLFQSGIGFILTWAANKASKKVTDYGLW